MKLKFISIEDFKARGYCFGDNAVGAYRNFCADQRIPYVHLSRGRNRITVTIELKGGISLTDRGLKQLLATLGKGSFEYKPRIVRPRQAWATLKLDKADEVVQEVVTLLRMPGMIEGCREVAVGTVERAA